MKLELPDNNASVLFHMGNALQSIARDIDTSLPVNGHKSTHTETVGDVSHSVTVEPLMVMATGDKNPINIDASERRYLDESELSDAIDNMTDAIAAEHEIPVNLLLGASDTIDADGLPWDQRIHSRGKTRLADNTWRMARKPSDKSDEEWAEYVEGIKTELKALMAIPVATGAELDVLANIPVITAEQRVELKVHVDYAEDPNEVDPFAIDVGPFYWEHPESCSFGILQTREQLNDYLMSDGCCVEITKKMYDKLLSESKDVVDAVVTPPVVDAVVTPPVVDAVVAPPVVDAVIAPPVDAAVIEPPVEAAVIAPPVDAAVIAPPVDAAVIGPTTFPELMKFITVNNKKLTKESVDEALKAQGLASIALLAARTDLIPQVHAALVKLL